MHWIWKQERSFEMRQESASRTWRFYRSALILWMHAMCQALGHKVKGHGACPQGAHGLQGKQTCTHAYGWNHFSYYFRCANHYSNSAHIFSAGTTTWSLPLWNLIISIKFRDSILMVTFPTVIHGLQRIVTIQFFKDDNTLFTSVFLKVLIKDVSFKNI